MPADLVSCILLTTHPKRAAFLPDAVASYRAQTHAPRELVVVNDGPVRLRSDSSDIVVVNLPARGHPWTIGEKRNVGVRHAQGEWLATWDDDDISLPHRLTEQLRHARGMSADYVMADRMHIADADMRVYGSCFRSTNRPTMPSALVRRDLVVRAGGYPAKNYMEDAELLERVRLLARGRVSTMFEADFYVMRRHGSNVTNSFGESDSAWKTCALKDPEREKTQAAVDAVRQIHANGDILEA